MDEAHDSAPASMNAAQQLLNAVGLKDLRGVTDFSLGWNGVHLELTVTRMVTRQQAALLAAHLERSRYLLSEPVNVGSKSITPAEAPGADFRPTPTFHRPGE